MLGTDRAEIGLFLYCSVIDYLLESSSTIVYRLWICHTLMNCFLDFTVKNSVFVLIIGKEVMLCGLWSCHMLMDSLLDLLLRNWGFELIIRGEVLKSLFMSNLHFASHHN